MPKKKTKTKKVSQHIEKIIPFDRDQFEVAPEFKPSKEHIENMKFHEKRIAEGKGKVAFKKKK